MKRILILTIVIAVGLAMGNAAQAVDYNDAATGTWGTPSTWSPAGIPGSGDNVTIKTQCLAPINKTKKWGDDI